MVHKLFHCFNLILLVASSFLVVVNFLILLDHAVLLFVELISQLFLSVFFLDSLHDFFVSSDMKIFGSFFESLALDPYFFFLTLLNSQNLGRYLSLYSGIIRLFMSKLVFLLNALFAPCVDITLDLLQFIDALWGQRLISQKGFE